jgi:hypothetical protein
MAMDHTPDHAGYGLTVPVAGKTFGHGGAFGTS